MLISSPTDTFKKHWPLVHKIIVIFLSPFKTMTLLNSYDDLSSFFPNRHKSRNWEWNAGI